MVNNSIRNVAIIAHVDHGKTTLVDQMLRQGGVFRLNQVVAERVMDSNAIEKERGITILAKNTSVKYGNYKINVVDTPGHADFGGEVERILKMVNGVILLIDAYEGPMPQTRFVLEKALELKHRVIIVINKIDRPDARLNEIGDEVLELLLELDADGEQIDSPIVYCSGRQGTASLDPNKSGTDLVPLFETIVRYLPAPEGDPDAPFKMLVSALDYSDYVGTMGIGRVEHGRINQNEFMCLSNYHHEKPKDKHKVSGIYQFEGLARAAVQSAEVGDIVCVAGIEGVTIGDTICNPADLTPLPFVKITEPSVEMTFSVNDSPFAGREGKYVTSRHLRDRLYKEMIKDVSIRVSDTDTAESFRVSGRGEMHLSILIENMRREGYEFAVGQPKVLYREIDGKKCEPIDRLVVDVPEDCVGAVIEKMGMRKGELLHITPHGRMRLEFKVPARGLFGYKSEFLTDTKGEGILNSVFLGYEEFKGEITRRLSGSLIAYETGEAVTYGLYNAQERGVLFITPGTPVYEGMVVGMNPKNDDITVNVCKKKHITNMRASGSDDALRLTPPKILSLEQALEFIADDELLEVTPKNIRVRKKALTENERRQAFRRG